MQQPISLHHGPDHGDWIAKIAEDTFQREDVIPFEDGLHHISGLL